MPGQPVSLVFDDQAVVDICDAAAELLRVQCLDRGGTQLHLSRNPSDRIHKRTSLGLSNVPLVINTLLLRDFYLVASIS